METKRRELRGHGTASGSASSSKASRGVSTADLRVQPTNPSAWSSTSDKRYYKGQSPKTSQTGSDRDDGKRPRTKAKGTADGREKRHGKLKGRGKDSKHQDVTGGRHEWDHRQHETEEAATDDDMPDDAYSAVDARVAVTAPQTPDVDDANPTFTVPRGRPSCAASIPPALGTGFPRACAQTKLGAARGPPSVPRADESSCSPTKTAPITTAMPSKGIKWSTTCLTEPASHPPSPPPVYETYEYDYYEPWGAASETDAYEEGVEDANMDTGLGHAWHRHTTVHGGNVCLACAAAGEQGGFYGINVPPEQKYRR